jgi:hypothetical protein
MGRPPIVGVLLMCGAVLGCGAARPAQTGSPAITATSARVASNILTADYAGSARCAGCHAEITSAWQSSPMHLMTRLADGARIRAPFDGREFRFKDDVARLTQEDGARYVDLSSPTGGRHRYRVTRVIGGRYREDFVGIEMAGAERVGPELILPISYMFETGSFRLKGYSVLVAERPGLRAGGVWTQTCIFCHNTVPYFDDVWGALHGPGAPGYQGEVVDRLLPPDRRLGFVMPPDGEHALVDAVDTEVRRVGGTPAPGDDPQ